MRRSLVSVFLLLASCSSQDGGTIRLVTGEETDTFSQAPVAATLTVQAVQSFSDGGVQRTTLATGSLPTTSIDLGSVSESAAAILSVGGFAGSDAGGEQVLQGSSLLLDFSSLVGATIPIFVQRKGQFARLPTPLTEARQAPTLAILQDQYLIVGGGGDPALAETAHLYDFLALSPVESAYSLPCVPKSIALDGAVAWLIDSDAGYNYFFSNQTSGAITLPAGGTFADIAGGATIADENGVLYVVGPTRLTGARTAKVLKIDPTNTSDTNYPYGEPTWITLSASRLGAAATWVVGTGLIVSGGSVDAPGVEIVEEGTDTVRTLTYPVDPSGGAGATALDSERVLLAGGTVSGASAGVRIVDLQCMTACSPASWPDLPVALTSVQAFSASGANIVVVGSEPSSEADGGALATAGLTHVYSLSSAGPVPIPTKVTHTNAHAIASPIGTLVLFGGAGEVESFVP